MTVHYYREFKRLCDATDFIKQEQLHYPPYGYGTSLRTSMVEGKYVVTGYRSASCD
jgi:hypothetical protein